MDETLQCETGQLEHAWMRHDGEMLREYLVADVEDPRLNIQSILTRHFLIVGLAGQHFERLIEQELRFAMAMNWARKVLPELGGTEDLRALRHALDRGADSAEGMLIPGFIAATFRILPQSIDGLMIPNYLAQILDGNALQVDGPVLATFQRIWAQALASHAPSGRSVLEPACGSANDYRFLDAYGIARLLDYTGFDLCEKNVRNAEQMFPGARFQVGNAFEVPGADVSFDYAVVHDLFEHLSIAGMERALGEISRVTRKALCLGFFNAWEEPEHVVRPTENYHWNTLSLPKVKGLLEAGGFAVQMIHIDTFLRWRFGCDQTHNKNAYTLFAERML